MAYEYRNTNMSPKTGNYVSKEDVIVNVIDGGLESVRIATTEESSRQGGGSFIAMVDFSAPASGSVQYILDTGSAERVVLSKIKIVAENSVNIEVYEGAEDITVVDAVELVNFNRITDRIPTINIFENSTVADPGELIFTFPVDAGISEVAQGVTLKEQTVYVIVVDNTDNNVATDFKMHLYVDERYSLHPPGFPDDMIVGLTLNGEDVLKDDIYYFNENEKITELNMNLKRPVYLIDPLETGVLNGEDVFGDVVPEDWLGLNYDILPVDDEIGNIADGVLNLIVPDLFRDERNNVWAGVQYDIKFIQNIEIDGYEGFDDIYVYELGDLLADDADVVAYLGSTYNTAKIDDYDAYTPITAWVADGAYTPNVAGTYTYDGTLGDLPVGYSDVVNPTTDVPIGLIILEADAYEVFPDIEDMEFADAQEVIDYLEEHYLFATLDNAEHPIQVPIDTWADGGTFDPLTPDTYMFVGTLGTLPLGLAPAAVPVTSVSIGIVVAGA